MLLVGFVFYSLTASEPVKVMSSHLKRKVEGCLVAAEVRNTTDRKITGDLEVHCYERQGRPLGQDTLILDGLEAGAVRDFKNRS